MQGRDSERAQETENLCYRINHLTAIIRCSETSQQTINYTKVIKFGLG